MNSKLTDQQRKFADEYIKTLNATDAYRKAGYKPRSEAAANANASRLIRNDKVKAYLQQAMQEHHIDEFMTQQEILKNYADIAKGEEVTEKYESRDLSKKKPKIMTKSTKTYTPNLSIRLMALDSLVRYRQILNSDTDLNQAKTDQAKAQARKAQAEAELAEYKVKLLTGDTDGIDKTVILDDLEGDQDERNKD